MEATVIAEVETQATAALACWGILCVFEGPESRRETQGSKLDGLQPRPADTGVLGVGLAVERALLAVAVAALQAMPRLKVMRWITGLRLARGRGPRQCMRA